MVDRELEFKVTASPDSQSFAATKKEFREAAREVDKSRTPVEKLNDEYERLDNLQRKGLISEEKAARRRRQLGAQHFQDRLGEVGLGQFGVLFGARGPLVAGMAALTVVMTSFVQLMRERAGELDTAEELGVSPREFSGLRRMLARLDISTGARDRGARVIADYAFRRRLSLEDAFDEIRARVQAGQDFNQRARIAEGLGLGRDFGDAFGAAPQGRFPPAMTEQQERVLRRLRQFRRRGIDEFVPTPGVRGPERSRGFDPATSAAERELDALFGRNPVRVRVEEQAEVNTLE